MTHTVSQGGGDPDFPLRPRDTPKAHHTKLPAFPELQQGMVEPSLSSSMVFILTTPSGSKTSQPAEVEEMQKIAYLCPKAGISKEIDPALFPCKQAA